MRFRKTPESISFYHVYNQIYTMSNDSQNNTTMANNYSNFRYGLTSSYDSMVTTLKTMETITDLSLEQQNKVFVDIGTVLHWIMNSWERRDKLAPLSVDEQTLMNGFRHANNLLKHNQNFVEFHHKSVKHIGGFDRSGYDRMRYDRVEIKIQFLWANVDEIPVERKDNRHLSDYNHQLRGKEIIDTLKNGKILVMRCLPDA